MKATHALLIFGGMIMMGTALMADMRPALMAIIGTLLQAFGTLENEKLKDEEEK